MVKQYDNHHICFTMKAKSNECKCYDICMTLYITKVSSWTNESFVITCIGQTNLCTLRTNNTSEDLFWRFSLSEIGDLCQYLEGPQ